VASLKTRPFVERNNAEFTNVHSFTSLLMFRASFTLSCRILLLALPTSNNSVQFVFVEIPEQSALGSSLGPPYAGCLCGHCSSSELGSVVFRTFNMCDLSTQCRKLLNFIFCLSLVFSTQKMHWAVNSLADTYQLFQPFDSFPQNWVITEVLVCPSYALREFTALDNSIRFLYLEVCFSFFPVFPNVASCIMPIMA
jgi:hypothetical protein